MRLLHTTTHHPHTFLTPPRYAILSHTWTASELTFQDLTTAFQDLPTPGPAPAAHPGYPKLRAACALAAREGFEYIWIDTVCIDKTSSAELSEAINSMFAWYQGAAVCYAFLADVGAGGGGTLAGSRWFTRGWTLQELIAPAVVVFLDGAWREVGTKSSLVGELAAITGVDEGVLVPRSEGVGRRWAARFYSPGIRGVLDACSVAQRMSWAAGRTTTRVEDGAYSLMGLFDVNMPLLYGEGEKAFLRLQREIMQQSDDMSIFVWKYPGRAGYVHRSGLLAPAPSCFEGYGDVRPSGADGRGYSVSKNKIRLHVPVMLPPPETLSEPSPEAESDASDPLIPPNYHSLPTFYHATLPSPLSTPLSIALLDCATPHGRVGLVLYHAHGVLSRAHLHNNHAPLLLPPTSRLPVPPRTDIDCALVLAAALSLPQLPVYLPWVRLSVPVAGMGYSFRRVRRLRYKGGWADVRGAVGTGEVEFSCNDGEAVILLFEQREEAGGVRMPPFLLGCARYLGDIKVKVEVLVLKVGDEGELGSEEVLAWREGWDAKMDGGEGGQVRIGVGGGWELVVKNRPSPRVIDVVVLMEKDGGGV